MSVNFKFALVEINGKPVLVDRKALDDAAKSLRDAIEKITVLKDAVLTNGFALQTPEGMSPVTLGSANDFSVWVSNRLAGGSFNLKASIETLPDPFKSGLAALTNTDLVVYSAALFYTGDTGKPETKNKMYGELVIGFQVPKDFMTDFPLRLREIVIQVNNYPSK
jgi:hypothetical protein